MSGWFLFFAQMLFFLLGAWYFLRSGSRRKGGRDGISMEENEREMEKLFSYTLGRNEITVADIDAICTCLLYTYPSPRD